MSEWEQRNRTSSQAAPDTNMSLTSILVTVPAEVEAANRFRRVLQATAHQQYRGLVSAVVILYALVGNQHTCRCLD